jgi:hypothetical protein
MIIAISFTDDWRVHNKKAAGASRGFSRRSSAAGGSGLPAAPLRSGQSREQTSAK